EPLMSHSAGALPGFEFSQTIALPLQGTPCALAEVMVAGFPTARTSPAIADAQRLRCLITASGDYSGPGGRVTLARQDAKQVQPAIRLGRITDQEPGKLCSPGRLRATSTAASNSA